MENPKRPIYLPQSYRPIRPSQLLANGPISVAQPSLIDVPYPPLRFRVKRHRATRLHTDFRFEVFDTLFSLASYDLPSLDPRKPIRLREMPDHETVYMDVERRIPDGSYGAGPMLVWDYGTYAPLFPFEGSPSEAVLKALLAGSLEFRFAGTWLQGAYRLEIGPRDWHLTKLEDEFASSIPQKWVERSALTGKTLDDIEREYRYRRGRWPLRTP